MNYIFNSIITIDAYRFVPKQIHKSTKQMLENTNESPCTTDRETILTQWKSLDENEQIPSSAIGGNVKVIAPVQSNLPLFLPLSRLERKLSH